MYFTIEELTPENNESPEQDKKPCRTSWRQRLAKIFHTIQTAIIQGISFIQKWLGAWGRQLSARGEIILMFACVAGISGAVLLVHFYFDRSTLALQKSREQEIQQLSREYRLLQQAITDVRIDVEKSILYHAGSNLLDLNTLLIAIADQLGREIYFTQLDKMPQSSSFSVTGSAPNLGKLLQLESFLHERCISVDYSVNIQEDRRTDFELSFNPQGACLI